MKRITPILMLLVLLSRESNAADWPMYGADSARSFYTPQALPQSLMKRWRYEATNPPMPAWPTRERLRFDAAFQPIVVDGRLYFGSSANGKVVALDASSGETCWTYDTGGPIRFAPASWRDRLFIASDDGHLYCLNSASGKLVWKMRGGPREEMILGNDRMISRWPARGGPVVVEDTVYFAAGIWPSEGVFLYAVSAESGQVVWCNDSTGTLVMDQPHKSARARSGVAVQGYLAAFADTLLAPTGRAVPAAFSRSNGELRFFQLQPNQHRGGADVVATDKFFFNGGTVYSLSDGSALGDLGLPVAVHPQQIITTADGKVVAWDRRKLFVENERTDRRGEKIKVEVLGPPAWQVDVAFNVDTGDADRPETKTPDNVMDSTAWSRTGVDGRANVILVTDNMIVIGGKGRVTIIDIESRIPKWSTDVRGVVHGLAVANESLYVSTDQGIIECFAQSKKPKSQTATSAPRRSAIVEDPSFAAAAEEILKRTGAREGYCLDLCCGDGRLAIELARRSNLQICAVDADPTNIQMARQLVEEAGLLGVRITVICCDPTNSPFPNHFADLVVSGRSVKDGLAPVASSSATRMLSPHHGIACFGPPGAMQTRVRGPLAGEGDWKHQNGDLGNTLCSHDTIVRSPLEMLWFRDTDLVMPNRHGRGPGPLVHKGVMFIEGLNCLRAQSIYNGRTLWEFPLPGLLASYHREHSIGAAWTGGNYCVNGSRVYVHQGNRCLCLDAMSGKLLAEYKPPAGPDGHPGTWGYIACDGDLIYGSLVDEEYLVKCWSERWDTSEQFTESLMLFAMEAATGKVKWTFTPQESIRHNTIALGGGRMYLVDRTPAPFDNVRLSETDARSAARRQAKANGDKEENEYQRLISHNAGRLMALDVQSGLPVWIGDQDSFATLLIYSSEHDVVLAAYQAVHQATRDSERGNRFAAYNAANGKTLWDAPAQYEDRPVVLGRTIYAPPAARDLLTGAPVSFNFERSYGCGILVGSQRLLVFRSATLGYLDLKGTGLTENYGGVRPGCWIAGIPAGGLLLMQDAASWCTCSYLNQATIALQPRTLDNRP